KTSGAAGFFATAAKTVGLVTFYYTFSIGLTFYNKWMFKRFRFPLMTTCIHFITIFVLSALLRTVFGSCRKTTTTLEWGTYIKKVFLTGVASAMDIGLSNWSFVFITVSLYTMVKSSAIVFILGFSVLLRLEPPRFSIIFVVLLISGGLFMFVFESTQFNLEGFVLVLSASFIGGIRWTLSQILTQKQELGCLGNPIDLLYHLQPTMFIALFPLALSQEGNVSSSCTLGGATETRILNVFVSIIVGGAIAFMLSFSEYLLLSNTSSLTLSVSGILKEIVTLLLATSYNGDQLTPLNWGGFALCIFGICLHVLLKLSRGE
uniref:Sugar phosphate transporter domain-containing protein n=1 Tax=Ciona savignyi TaxID=51511 RepID=H2YKG4_CIOSA